MANELAKKINFDYAQIGSVNLHYATAGNGGQLVILLHGFPEFWYSWRHQLIDLSDNFTVVAPDMRGYNLSDKPKDIADYDIDKLVDDVSGLIRYFGHNKAFVVGHDWGAIVAWEVAIKHPELVEKLVTLQIPPTAVWKKNQTFKQLLSSWYMFFFQIPKLPEWLLSSGDYKPLADGLRKSTNDRSIFTDEVISEYKKAWSEQYALKSALNYYRANVIKRLLNKQESSKKSKVPTLFIYGEKDQVVLPETVQGVGEFIDNEYVEVRIPTAGHFVQQEAAEAVTDAIREFISSK